MIVRVAQPESYPWLAGRLGLSPSEQFRAIEAVRPDGSIAGMIGYDGWTPNSVTLHIALDSMPALRCLLRAGFVGAFELGQRQIANCVVRSDNARSLRLVKHLGFRKVATLRDAWAPGVHFVVFEMRKAECRWLKEPARKAA